MLLVNKKRLTDPENAEAKKEYEIAVAEIRKEYGEKGFITLVRPGYPSRDKKTGYVLPTPPMVVPYERMVSGPETGQVLWSYCASAPKLQPNGLYDISTRSKQIEDSLGIDINKDIDLAFYILYKSGLIKNQLLEVYDPGKEARKKGEETRQRLLIESAIWQTLNDDKELRLVASAWGIDHVYTKEPDAVRVELQALLEKREKQRRDDPTIKGVEAFLASMKEKDSIKAQSVLKRLVDNGSLVYNKDSRKYLVGANEIVSVPLSESEQPFAFLCRRMEKKPNEMISLFKETFNNKFVESIGEYDIYIWLAKLVNVSFFGKKQEELMKEVKEAFCA